MLPLEIAQVPPLAFRYSICTLVTNWDEYERMWTSFVAKGFTADKAEFLYIDNREKNQYEAFAGLNALLHKARGEYVVLCHQDIELLEDGIEKLDQRIAELNQMDAQWALLGNAGASRIQKMYLHISHRDRRFQSEGPFPARVHSLDENFIVLRKAAHLGFSADLGGFHFYGTDLCLQADFRGYHAYVVDFNVWHKGQGVMNPHYFEVKAKMLQKYRRALRTRWIQTPTTRLFLHRTAVATWFFNRKWVSYLLKQWYKLLPK
ncbi:MAG: hypothetical protein HC913_08235 [Microscillaceae bacterium]|nr:hypothetical protein [Microscillaceae bacterium]